MHVILLANHAMVDFKQLYLMMHAKHHLYIYSQVMRTIKPGMMEYKLESLFQHYCYAVGGCRHYAWVYTCGT